MLIFNGIIQIGDKQKLENEKTQIIEITPEELQQIIQKALKTELQNFIKHFQSKEPTEYMTRNEVAEFLKVDLSAVWNWIKKGKLIAYGLGKRVYFKRKEVEKAIIRIN